MADRFASRPRNAVYSISRQAVPDLTCSPTVKLYKRLSLRRRQQRGMMFARHFIEGIAPLHG
jgi:hypothetical protein